MIIDWNNFNNLVFYKIFLEIYISLNNSLMQARYFCPKIFLIFFEKICQSKNDQKNYWSSDFMYKTCPTIYFLTKILCSWGKWVPLKLPTTPSMVTDTSTWQDPVGRDGETCLCECFPGYLHSSPRAAYACIAPW